MSLTTNVTLLEKIIDGDEISWDNFHRLYAPLIRNCGEHWHLTADECDELIQEVMIVFFRDSKSFKYDRNYGSFRAYLGTVARSCIFNILEKRENGTLPLTENSNLLDFAFDEKWDAEWYDHLCSQALSILENEMEDVSFRSFQMYVIDKIPPATVAARLGISLNAVYVNKFRALEHLRHTIRHLNKL